MTTTTAYETATAVPAVPLSRREEQRQDARLRQELELQREAARAEQRRLDDQAWAEERKQGRTDRDARRAARRDSRAKARGEALGWLQEHTVDLLFVPVIVIPGSLAWDAMAAYGASVWGSLGIMMPAFSEGAMWAFSAAVAIRQRRNDKLGEDKPFWHLQLGVGIFAAYGAVLNFLHGVSPTTAHHGLVVALSMAIVSVAGVTAHQLVVAGPRRNRVQRELDRFRRRAERRQALARRASVDRALIDVDEEGHADLVYEPGLYRLRRGVTGHQLAAPKKGRPQSARPARTRPALDDVPVRDEDPEPAQAALPVRDDDPEPVREAAPAPLQLGPAPDPSPYRPRSPYRTTRSPYARPRPRRSGSAPYGTASPCGRPSRKPHSSRPPCGTRTRRTTGTTRQATPCPAGRARRSSSGSPRRSAPRARPASTGSRSTSSSRP